MPRPHCPELVEWLLKERQEAQDELSSALRRRDIAMSKIEEATQYITHLQAVLEDLEKEKCPDTPT